MNFSFFKHFLFTATLFSALTISADIAVFIPTDPAAPLGTTAGNTITVNPSEFCTPRRFSIQPTGAPDVVRIAPYYYRAQVTWKNADGSAFMTNGAGMTSHVYLAVIYDYVAGCWRDVSSVPLSEDVRGWTHAADYFLCSPSFGGIRYLQAFATGASAASILYAAVAAGTQIPVANTLSPTETDILNTPAAFFTNTGAPRIIYCEAAEQLIDNQTTATFLEANPLATSDTTKEKTITVIFPSENGTNPTEYKVSEEDIFVFHNPGQAPQPLPEELNMHAAENGSPNPGLSVTPESRFTLPQAFLTIPLIPASTPPTPAAAGTTPSTTAIPDIYKASTQWATNNPSLQCASYYLRTSTLCIALQPTYTDYLNPGLNKFTVWQSGANATSSVTLSSDKTKITIKAVPYYASQAHSTKNIYTGADGLVMAAHKEFFEGQALFYKNSLRTLKGLQKADVDANPFWAYPLTLNQQILTPIAQAVSKLLYYAQITKNVALAAEALNPAYDSTNAQLIPQIKDWVRQAEALAPTLINSTLAPTIARAIYTQTTNAISLATMLSNYETLLTQELQKAGAAPSAPSFRPLLPVLLSTPSETFKGILCIKTGYFEEGKDMSTYLAPSPYYLPVTPGEKYQVWYSAAPGTILQLPNNLSSSLVSEIRPLSTSAITAWPADLFNQIIAKAQPFLGVEKEKPSIWKRIASVFRPSAVTYADRAA